MGNGFSAFRVHLHDLDIAPEGRVVDEIAVSLAVLGNIHIKVVHQFPALPALGLSHRVDAVGHGLGLSEAVFITGQGIALGLLRALKTAR